MSKTKHYAPTYEVREDKDGRKYKVLYCVKCNVDVTSDMEHCEDCDICVYGYDHHCVFFSKCIGGKNIFCFGGSIGMLIFNFVLLFIFMLLDIKEQTPSPKSLKRNHHLHPLKQPVDLKNVFNLSS